MTGFVCDPVYKRHDAGYGHPEAPGRIDAVRQAMEASDFRDRICLLSPRAATETEILACHTKRYFDTVRRDNNSGMHSLSTGDTSVSEESWDVALQAAGGLLVAVDAIVESQVKNAFCAVRPPGHHATPTRGMGFCVFNNVAIAARYAQRKHGVGKILIADWDVHHGNGTQEIFYEDGSVFFFSTHQFPWYPGTGWVDETGAGPGRGTTLNCPVKAGSGREEVLGAFEERLLPAANAFKPDMVMISAGFDSRVGDPLGLLRLTDKDFADLTRLMLAIAKEHAGGRLLSVLEGGYSLHGLASAVCAHVRELAAAE
jgi:acetoin utilization deacetylase AcuC-like enzyme